MPKDRHPDGQLSLNFEQPVDVREKQAQQATALQEGTSKPTGPRLMLVFKNDQPRRLAPNSAEVTRLLAEQARELRW